MSLSEVLTHQENFYKDRPEMWEANTVGYLIQALIAEAHELGEEPDDYMDQQTYHEQELADVFLFAFALADRLKGEQVLEDFVSSIIMEKISRNMCKYAAKYFQKGIHPNLGLSVSRAEWKALNGNEEFYSPQKETVIYQAPQLYSPGFSMLRNDNGYVNGEFVLEPSKV
jgi:NTP pyrophosphatase (non-canonical NTP hydrolase)